MKPRSAQKLSTNPDAARHLDLARAHERAGRLREAAAAYKHAARAQPKNASILTRLAQVQRAIGDVPGALDTLSRASKLDPRSASPHIELGLLHVGEGDLEKAMESFTRGVWLDRSSVFARLGKADIHERSNELNEAAAEIDDALTIEPSHPYARILRSRVLARQGKPGEARATLQALLIEDIPDEVRYRASYQLARILDRLGDHDAAFDAVRVANESCSRTRAFRSVDPTPWLRNIEQAGTLSGDLFRRAAERAGAGAHDGPPPVFLVGFPRSGTTMTEQILSAHPDAAVTNEADLFSPMAGALFHGLDQTRPLVELCQGMTDDRIHAARRAYRAAAASHLGRTPNATLLVDKQPMAIVSLGLLNIVFPEARVIHALRDPRDVCLSCLFQEFVPNAGNVHFLALDRTLALYRLVIDLFLAQRDALTLDLLECRYEDTVADLARQARRLLDFLDLSWDDAVMQFHAPEHRRRVGTPSYEAITAPVHTGATRRWERYRAHLEPILDGLSPYVRAFGYE